MDHFCTKASKIWLVQKKKNSQETDQTSGILLAKLSKLQNKEVNHIFGHSYTRALHKFRLIFLMSVLAGLGNELPIFLAGVYETRAKLVLASESL